MSADRLREAAKVLRDQAARAAMEPWGAEVREDGAAWVNTGHGAHTFSLHGWPTSASYIATMHPGVGLILARLLDNAAEDLEMQSPGGELHAQWDIRVYTTGSIANEIADRILGGAS